MGGTGGPHLLQFLGPGKNLCEICTRWVENRLNSTGTNLIITNSTSRDRTSGEPLYRRSLPYGTFGSGKNLHKLKIALGKIFS